MNSFALYRLPHATQCTLVEQVEGLPEELLSPEQLNDRSGFVLAPFNITPGCPLLLLHADRITAFPLDALPQALLERWPQENANVPRTSRHASLHRHVAAASRNDYTCDFSKFYHQLQNGTFQKLVLSRCASIPFRQANEGSTGAMLQLFCKACARYPRLFICLVSTPLSGTWLAATPEILLEGQDNHWRTIALAGTMQLEGDSLQSEGEDVTWSTKNIQEQRYVATYLAEQLKPFVSDLHEEGPRTVRAANLVHLRSDFTFTLYNNTHVGSLLQALHPTPAVCGLPKRQAQTFILSNEHSPRQYYSGFMGPLHIPPGAQCPSPATHLYVSLRCMQIGTHEYSLYAGGGLLRDSMEEMEWQETEAKMQTMKALLSE